MNIHLKKDLKEGREFRRLYKEMNKTGAVIDKDKLGLLQMKVNDALRRAQLYAERRILLRDQVEEKTYLNKRIEKATKERDIQEILRLQKINRLLNILLELVLESNDRLQPKL